ncbi:hypothetical protein [Bacillus cereus group sp. BfR-BA-01379]|uniref:hypothetical protein n=1 Tax=Bacillus cereus group sp. BfR-BA-01379 TaxID=2920323 RepID=UPI001F5AA13F|nr:hypothetical protein [Bacillus cereus group sp. BfR-BA-01379]
MYKEHCKNLQKINTSIQEVEDTIKYSIKTQNTQAIILHTNIHTFLIGAWIEVSLYKLIHEQKFDDNDRNFILRTKTKSSEDSKDTSLENKWINVLNLAFARAFSIEIDDSNFKSTYIKKLLKRTQQHRYQDILNFVNEDINQVVRMRNKIAHGQWHFTFDNKVTRLEPDVQQLIHSNNYFKSRERLETVKVIIEMIQKIAMSPTSFDRDFDNLYSKITTIPPRYTKGKYKENEKILIEKHKRAEYWRKINYQKGLITS